MDCSFPQQLGTKAFETFHNFSKKKAMYGPLYYDETSCQGLHIRLARKIWVEEHDYPPA